MRRPRVPRDLLDPVVDYFKPGRVILLGSRARGEASRDSDIDLLVVVDDTPPEKLTSEAGYEAHRSRHAADVFPMRAGKRSRKTHSLTQLGAATEASFPEIFESCRSGEGLEPLVRRLPLSDAQRPHQIGA
jgi:hypothetical protein